MSVRSVPGDRAEKLAGQSIDDRERPLVLGLPVSPPNLDKGPGVGPGVGLRDGDEAGDEQVLARGEHGRRIVRPPGAQRHAVVRESRFTFQNQPPPLPPGLFCPNPRREPVPPSTFRRSEGRRWPAPTTEPGALEYAALNRSTRSFRTGWYQRPIVRRRRHGLRSAHAPYRRPSRGARGPHRSHPFHWSRSRQECPREAVAEVPPLRNCDHALRVRRVHLADAREALVSPPPWGRPGRGSPPRRPIRRPALDERDPDRPVRVSSRPPPGHPRVPGGARPWPPRPGRRPRAWRGCSPRGRRPSSR